MHPKDLSIENYSYPLPVDRIALHPLENRDHSKLLVYNSKTITEDRFLNLAHHLRKNSVVVFNNTKVIPARIFFPKTTGGIIEIFCLEPFEMDHTLAMQARYVSCWKCMIGGASKWKSGPLTRALFYEGVAINLTARLIQKNADAYVVEFSWDVPSYSFTQILHAAGEIPLPPYIKRKVEADDTSRYQTIYADDEGSVAAPTAGLHFTNELLNTIKEKDISLAFITLHVGAGTFKPVKSNTMAGHSMHAEFMDVTRQAIESILQYIGNITTVGTTTLRVTESLYWMGVKCCSDTNINADNLAIRQWEVYEKPLIDSNIDPKQALTSLLEWMIQNDLQRLVIPTSILIAPGYKFRISNALVTNFHQPGSTLILLVAAITGENWRNIYDYALSNDFRFLSYGDGCLLSIS